jgi:hypothetical protein
MSNKIKNIEVDLFENMTAETYDSLSFVTHKSAPKGYPKDKSEYADPKNYKYPLNTEEHVRAAWSYINMPKNQKGYTPSEVAEIKSRIKRAGKKFGIDFESDKKKD